MARKKKKVKMLSTNKSIPIPTPVEQNETVA
jgi:hypothetical protein